MTSKLSTAAVEWALPYERHSWQVGRQEPSDAQEPRPRGEKRLGQGHPPSPPMAPPGVVREESRLWDL